MAVTHSYRRELQLSQLPSPPTIKMVKQFMLFLWGRRAGSDEEDWLIGIELEHSIVR